MIIYGSNAKHLGSEQLSDECPHCGNSNSTQLDIYQKYAHIFWIPLFPLGKKGATVCTHCKQVFTEKEMPQNFKNAFEQTKGHYRAPFYLFSGLILIALLIGLGMYNSSQNAKENIARMQAPKKGDIYEVKSDGKYTLYKVFEVLGDTVYVLNHLYETNKTSGLSDLKAKGDAGYDIIPVPMTKTELMKLLENGEIMDVERQ